MEAGEGEGTGVCGGGGGGGGGGVFGIDKADQRKRRAWRPSKNPLFKQVEEKTLAAVSERRLNWMLLSL